MSFNRPGGDLRVRMRRVLRSKGFSVIYSNCEPARTVEMATSKMAYALF